jgi:ABC-2 type transport system permease protein
VSATAQTGGRTIVAPPGAQPGRTREAAHAFLMVLWRDIFVTGRELPIFLAQVVLQPLFLLLIFGKILTELGYAQNGYAQLLFPGVVALTIVLTALQSTALPLVIDFSFTKEIEDRLLAPMPVFLVAIEKVIFAAMRALIAGAVMFPIGYWILGSLPLPASGVPLLITVMILGSLVGAAMGLTMGTLVPPNRIQVWFALILTPLLFTGASQYPWARLEGLPWFQVLTLFNPLTYVSEGLRAAMVPAVPHIRPWISILALLVSLAAFMAIGIRGFLRRALS